VQLRVRVRVRMRVQWRHPPGGCTSELPRGTRAPSHRRPPCAPPRSSPTAAAHRPSAPAAPEESPPQMMCLRSTGKAPPCTQRDHRAGMVHRNPSLPWPITTPHTPLTHCHPGFPRASRGQHLGGVEEAGECGALVEATVRGAQHPAQRGGVEHGAPGQTRRHHQRVVQRSHVVGHRQLRA
jgi:hypothetical protein